MKIKAEIMSGDQMRRALKRMSHEILEKNYGADNLVLLGIVSRGVPLAEDIAKNILDIEGVEVPVGVLDVSAFDDRRHVVSGSESADTETSQVKKPADPADGEARDAEVSLLNRLPEGEEPINPGFIAPEIDINGKDVVLVDDVIFTGRTTRAALDACSSFGRARTIQLAVLVDRGHREIPIRADYVGKNVPTSREERVNVLIERVDGVNAVQLVGN